MSDNQNCGEGGGSDKFFGLRVGSIFIILVGSTFGAMFPVVAAKSGLLHVPQNVYRFIKYFGSGVIIATAFIHLLGPAINELGSPCLSPGWRAYQYALALSMASVFGIFIVELFAFRIGMERLRKLGLAMDMHGHGHGMSPPAQPSAGKVEEDKLEAGNVPPEKDPLFILDENAVAQIIGIAILEFGVVLHSVLIGLTLAVDERFRILFIVIIFHQAFEGLGIGSRLALMKLPPKYKYVPYLGAILYGITTPIGIAAGLGVRRTYNPGSVKASIVSGILDSISSGILLYTGLVELLAHEFLFDPEMRNSSNLRVAYAVACMCLGCGLMALLGYWA